MNRLVLFDIDGTLLRGAGPHHKDALIAGVHQILGLHCTLEGIDTSGRLDRDLLHLMLANAGVSKRRAIPSLARIIEASQHHYTLQCTLDLSSKLCPGVTRVLNLLSAARIPMGLVTGNLSAIAWRKLELAGIAHYFSFGAFAEQATTRARLAKLAVWQARKKLLAGKRCQVVLIGDHANDIAAAQANGFRSVAVGTGLMPLDDLRRCGPSLVLPNLEDVSLATLLGDH